MPVTLGQYVNLVDSAIRTRKATKKKVESLPRNSNEFMQAIEDHHRASTSLYMAWEAYCAAYKASRK